MVEFPVNFRKCCKGVAKGVPLLCSWGPPAQMFGGPEVMAVAPGLENIRWWKRQFEGEGGGRWWA